MSEPMAGMEALQQQLTELRNRCEDIARVVTAGYHENLFWLRKIHYSSAIYLGDHVAMTFLANGCRAYIDTRSRDVGVHLLHGGSWETNYTEAFRRLLRPGARVVDVGANLGWYSLVAAPIVGAEGRIYAVEPNPELAGLVQASLRTNGFAGFARVFQVAVGDAPGVVDLISRPSMSGGGFIREFVPALADRPPEGARVASMRLDDVLSEEPQPIDVVKMDIEGWEGMALRGMQGVLDRSPGLRMLVEWGTAQDASPAPRSETAAMLAARGYRAFAVNDDGSLRATSWEVAVAMRALTNLVLLKADDPLAV
jgi:FkbM family methyltransferase